MNETDTPATGVETPSTNEDTVKTQASEASELSKETPEAAQSNESTTDVNAEDTATEKLYAGKYKSVEEMEKAYKGLESKFGQATNEKAELTRILNDAFVAPDAPTQSKAEDTDYGYQEEAAAINPEIDMVKRDLDVLKFIHSHENADGEAMKKILSEDPIVKNINGYAAKLEYAHLKAQSLSQGKTLEKAQKEAQNATLAKVAEKEVARVESAQKSEAIDENKELMSQAKNGSPGERKAARAQLIRKHLVNL